MGGVIVEGFGNLMCVKCLCVAGTRATTYLDVTFRGDVPSPVVPLGRHIGKDWSL